MASIVATTFSRMLKTLRENSSAKEKREALTYISSQAKKLEATGIIKEEQYKELCKLVIEIFKKEDGSMQYEVLGALTAIVQEFKAHSLHLFELLLQTNKKTRLKILKLLEIVKDDAVAAAINDVQIVHFFEYCMLNVLPSTMEWIAPTACVDNLQVLTNIEHHVLSDEQKLDEDTINCSLGLLRRLYKLTAIMPDIKQSLQRFDTLLMDKIITLAYMGHKRQRGPALKVLQQVVASNSALRISKDCPDLWTQYKTTLQSTYCKRMSLLVAACETDWSIQWNVAIQLLGTDLHRGANLINNLLSVEEKAFKSTDAIIRRQAFLSWKLLIDNFALDNQELATVRRIKLLCIPLNAKNSKTELIAVTKLEVWWHLIIKLYKDIAKFVTPVITQFLNFCFGPLGDTPLLSSKFDVVASPGKRFLKTKVVAVDVLYQLLVTKEETLVPFSPLLEERLPHAISHAVFQECSKSIIHSIGEALLILSQLTDQEMKNRYQLGKTLWTSLMKYIKDLKLETKDHLYKDVILIVTELVNHIDKPMVKDMMLSVILPDITYIIKNSEFNDYALPELVLKLLSFPILSDMTKENYVAIKCLLQRCVSPEIVYSTGVLGFLGTIMENLKSLNDTHKDMIVFIELWYIIAEILTKYMTDSKKIGDGNGNENTFKTIKSVLSFPFRYTFSENHKQMENYAITWKALYKQFESQSDSINTVKANEILLDTANMMRNCLDTNKNCCFLIVNCLSILLSTINYESLLTQDEIPSIMLLIVDVTMTSFNNVQHLNCEIPLKTLSAILITVYGHNTRKIVSYLHCCKPVIELILASEIKTLYKEIVNTWETVVSIFKGLNKQLDDELLLSYKQAIMKAMEHPNSDIQSLTRSIFENKDDFDNNCKHILNEIEKSTEKQRTPHSKSSNITKKKEETGKAKETVHDNFLNKKSANTKSISNKLQDTKTPVLPEPESQDYVYIKTDFKFDVNRLTEHQKETLKKKREDIPALYNDLSQSSSQNSQNLQEWFDIKAKHINETDKTNIKKGNSVTEKAIDNDANKENKDTIMRSEPNVTDKIINNNNSKLDEDIGENVDTKQNENLNKEIKKDLIEKDENKDLTKQADSTSLVTSSVKEQNVKETQEKTDDEVPISATRKLNFESREEFPESKTSKRQSSPSMLDNKRRYRNSITKSDSLLKSDEIVENQQESSSTNVTLRSLRTKVTPGKSPTNSKEKLNDDSDVKENSNENKRGIKHKYISDLEVDEPTTPQRRKRKLNKASNDEDNDKSRDNDNSLPDITDVDTLSQRVKNEISRLKIDMVFDCPVLNRRRIKYADESDKEVTLKKHRISDHKNPKSKSADVKPAEGSKKLSKIIEKDEKDTKDTKDYGLFKRRSRRSLRQEYDKCDTDVTKEIKKFNDNTGCVPESKNSTNTNTSATQAVLDEIQDEKSNRENSKCNSNKNIEALASTAVSKPNQDEIEDIVESSQTSNVGLKLDKRCGEKQCFIKINKMDVYSVKAIHAPAEKNYVPESDTMDHDDNLTDSCEKSDEANSDNHTNATDKGNKDDTNKNSVQEIDNTKVTIPENQKATDNSSSLKSANVTNFSSPRNNSKVLPKLKSFIPHGRAAHMLGLVTKQSRIESDNASVVPEDELSIKKVKTKDVDSEVSSTKKTKELDKIGGPSGSRQEKIFNNMRSADYPISPSTNMFSGLKNDGEKLSPKMSKSISDSRMEDTTDKENDGNISPSCEKNDLPILEWSSANPPSLNASPSASILKRHRTTMSELDLDWVTSNKRKRVSFADPPVSKEMGYEIPSPGSPHKANKYSSPRSPVTRKDALLKCKQTKLKFTSVELEKVTTESEAQNENEMEDILQEEKEDELLKKKDEVCSESMDIDMEASYSSTTDNTVPETNSNMECTIDDFAQVIEIAEEYLVSDVIEDQPSETSQNPVNAATIDYAGMEDSETQQDIFDGMDTKNNIVPVHANNNDADPLIQNNSDSVKLNVVNDSVIEALPTKEANLTSLEDTLDIQNIVEINSSLNTDEIFCGKLMRTSTHAKKNAEQDTLLATDSVFASLPLSQDTQSDSQNNVELDPQFLNSTQPIYPTLSSCQEPIENIVRQLANPLWKHGLCSYFRDRNIHTISDLAQLSEREINRIPLKGKPKTDFVKKVLHHFEKKYVLQAKSSDSLEESATALVATSCDDNVTVNNELLSSTPLSQFTEDVLKDLPTNKSLTSDKTESITSDISMDISLKPVNSINSDSSVLDASQLTDTTSIKTKILIIAQSLPGTSKDNDNLVTEPILTTAITNDVVPSSTADVDGASTVSAKIPNVNDEPFITYTSIGVNTDETCSSKPVKKVTRSAGSQMSLEELLDEINVNVLLESAVRRCTPKELLSYYKIKLGHLSKAELVKETIRLLGLQNKQQLNDVSLKAACRSCGVNKVLLRLPDIFSYDKQFFDKVLKVYKKKIKITDCLEAFDFAEVKNVICQRCTSSELIEMLSNKLKQDEQEGINQPMPELSGLNAMLQRLPMDVIISQTVANEELIPASLVLDIALQNNSSRDIARALKARSSDMAQHVLDKLWTSQFTIDHIEKDDIPKENLLSIFKSICSKLNAQELLDAYHEAMASKIAAKDENK